MRPPSLPATAPSQTPPKQVPPAPTLGFAAHTRRYFKASRWSVWFWIPNLLWMILVASLLKPILGVSGLVQSGFIAVIVAAIAGVAFIFFRFGSYFVLRRKEFPERPRSLTAKCAFGGSLLSIAFFGLAIAEKFAANEGILVSQVPSLKPLQTKFISTLTTKEDQAIGDEVNRQPADAPGDRINASNAIGEQGPSDWADDLAGSTTSRNDYPEPEPIRNFRTQTAPSSSTAGAVSIQGSTPALQSMAIPESFLATDRSIPPPGGTFSANLNPFASTRALSSPTASNGLSESNDNSVSYSEYSKAGQASELEAALGIDSRVLADRMTLETVPTPGGSFGEVLRIREDENLWGGSQIAPPPGGVF